MITMIVMLPSAGWFADRFGQQTLPRNGVTLACALRKPHDIVPPSPHGFGIWQRHHPGTRSPSPANSNPKRRGLALGPRWPPRFHPFGPLLLAATPSTSTMAQLAQDFRRKTFRWDFQPGERVAERRATPSTERFAGHRLRFTADDLRALWHLPTNYDVGWELPSWPALRQPARGVFSIIA